MTGEDKVLYDLIKIRSEIEFFDKLVKFGILDSTNNYINSLYRVSIKMDVIFNKKDWEDKDLLAVFDLYRRFNLIVFNLYNSLKKEV